MASSCNWKPYLSWFDFFFNIWVITNAVLKFPQEKNKYLADKQLFFFHKQKAKQFSSSYFTLNSIMMCWFFL